MKKFLLPILGLFFINTVPAQKSLFPEINHRVVVIAHRGNHQHVPENTLASFEQAIACHADFVEMDLRTTKDGKMVIMHDATVNRTTNGSGKVSDLTYNELMQLTVRPASASDTGHYKIPLFEDALRICTGKIHIYLDFKDANVVQAYDLIKAAGMEKQIVVYLNKEEQYSQWKSAAPQMPLMASIPENIKTEEALNTFLKKTPVEFTDSADPAMIPFLNKRHVAVWLDIQGNDEGPAKWNDALKMGVQGLQSDHPEDLVKFLHQN
ncbi:glycerophosphodiester phosphodiesterase family protein [Danxiaibacter flavus]|uniref:Glycerophosphodiester phosphodiesterase family protein n=1 Tax=Danxiaibacter flavus TaxID=3049108 RepID=A0ABV3ZN37_9BACT|nr:glycerophosphodiester phosphodiesterase family protein [Chitinophagaceae bacterium DXS]